MRANSIDHDEPRCDTADHLRARRPDNGFLLAATIVFFPIVRTDMLLSEREASLARHLWAVRRWLVKEAVSGKTLKCIIESPALSEVEIRTAAELVAEGGADFVKTAVGYEGGCDPDEVRAIREAVGPDVGVKASGGIRSFEEVLEMVEAGATRIGASAGVEIAESVQA